MIKMITLPLLVLAMVIFYYCFESQIMRALVWGTGDGMVNWYALGRLEENGEREIIGGLTRSPFAKTRLFAIRACDRMDVPEGLKALPDLIQDPNWEVRMTALAIARKRGYKAAGRIILQRLLGRENGDDGMRRIQLENGSLLESVDAVAAPENSELLAKLALEKNPSLHCPARAALWKLGPLPQAESAYLELLQEPDKYKASWEDRSSCLEAAAVLDLPGTLERLIEAAREAPAAARLRAIHALGSLGGDGAKKFLRTIVDAPEWAKATKFDQQRIKEAEVALERIRRKEQGLPDLESEPTPPPTEENPAQTGEQGEVSVDDLLDSYGSDATESTSGAGEAANDDAPEETIEDLLKGS